MYVDNWTDYDHFGGCISEISKIPCTNTNNNRNINNNVLYFGTQCTMVASYGVAVGERDYFMRKGFLLLFLIGAYGRFYWYAIGIIISIFVKHTMFFDGVMPFLCFVLCGERKASHSLIWRFSSLCCFITRDYFMLTLALPICYLKVLRKCAVESR